MKRFDFMVAAVVGVLLFVIQFLLTFIPRLAILAAITQTILTIFGCAATAVIIIKSLESLKSH